MSLDFVIDNVSDGSAAYVRVGGEVDVFTCTELRQALRTAEAAATIHIVLNLENVHYIDSVGLGVIAQSAELMRRDGKLLGVVCKRPQLKKIFDVSGLSKKNVRVFEDEAEALVGLRQR